MFLSGSPHPAIFIKLLSYHIILHVLINLTSLLSALHSQLVSCVSCVLQAVHHSDFSSLTVLVKRNFPNCRFCRFCLQKEGYIGWFFKTTLSYFKWENKCNSKRKLLQTIIQVLFNEQSRMDL